MTHICGSDRDLVETKMEYSAFENLTEEAFEMLKDANLDKNVVQVIKMVSEGKRTLPREITRSHLIDAMCYLMTEFGILKVEISKLIPASRTASQSHENQPQLKCSRCDKSFASKEELETHEGEHTDEKPFACSKCKKDFKSSEELKTHEKEHAEEKPFQCPKCDKKF